MHIYKSTGYKQRNKTGNNNNNNNNINNNNKDKKINISYKAW